MLARMRWYAVALSCAILPACGSASTIPTQRGLEVRPRLRRGALYEMLVREDQAIEGEPARVTRTRAYVSVEGERSDGTLRLRGQVLRVLREAGEDAHLAASVVHFDLGRDGRIAGEIETECDADDLRIEGFLRSIFDARAIVTDDAREGATWRAHSVSSAAAARYRIDALDDRAARGRFLADVRMTQDALGALRVTGTGRTRAHFSIDLADGFSGTTELESLVEGEIVDAPASRNLHGSVRTRTRVLVRPTSPQRVALVQCTPFDSSLVTQAIRLGIRPIQQCYEAQLRSDPTLSGRFLARLRVDVDGHFRGVTFPEDTLGSAELLACAGDVLSHLQVRFAPAAPVSYAYPFVFAPQN